MTKKAASKAPPKRKLPPKQPAKRKLTVKEQMFCEQYIIDFNATQAAIRAGYSTKCACEIGWENLRKPQIKAQIDKRIEETLTALGINQKRVLEELATIAFANATDFVTVAEFEIEIPNALDPEKPGTTKRYKAVDVKLTEDVPVSKRAAISEIRQTSDGISLKMHDKLAALDKLGRHLRLFGEGTKIEAKLGGKTPNEPAAVITIEL